jgi:AraC-like DNA-binding protein
MLEMRRAGVVGIANIATTPANLIRNASHLSDGNDAIVVQLWQQGLTYATQGKHGNQIKASDGLIFDNAKAAMLCVEEAARFWVLTIPRNKITGLRPRVNRFAGIKLGDELAVRLLFGYLEGTPAQDLGNDHAAQLFGNHLVDLVALAIGGEGDTREPEERGGVSAARLAAILQEISNQIANLGLSADTLAAQLGITPRYVHRLLEQSGQTFTQHVLQKRLEKAAELLVGDKGQDRRIADIAVEVGFSDLSHFNRAFRRHFGDTPSGVRANSGKRRT